MTTTSSDIDSLIAGNICSTCLGDGWVSGIDADPLPSGEPGEPYQVQETCPDCGGAEMIADPQPWTAAGKALVEAIESATPEDLAWMPLGARIAEIEREVAAAAPTTEKENQ